MRSAIRAGSPPLPISVVLSLSISIRRARPRSASVAFSSLSPVSSEITVAPVSTAMSPSIARRRSPNPGAFTAHERSTPRSELTTSVASASPVTSSAISSSGLPARDTCSSTGSRSCTVEIARSCTSTYAFSSTTRCFSASLTKYGDRNPRSNCMPSTTSSSLLMPRPSSVLMTPLSPTFAMASAIIAPIAASPLAEIVPTCAISPLVAHGRELRASSATTASTARSMPRFTSIGSCPDATYFIPSFTIDCARTVAVVVPSPADSDVFAATSRAICAPRFSKRSSSSISRATTTPELMIVGAPKARSRTTSRPFGPSVTFTAFARTLRPAQMRSRAS